MEERWRPVSGFEGYYEVSDFGRVRSLDKVVPFGTRARIVKGRVLCPYIRPDGYRTVRLGKGGKKSSKYIHRLTAEAFNNPCPGGMEVRHYDGNKNNNRAGNLKWGTRQENIDDNIRLGVAARGARHGHAKLTEASVLMIRADPRICRIIAADYGVSRGLVGQIKRRKIWSHLHG